MTDFPDSPSAPNPPPMSEERLFVGRMTSRDAPSHEAPSVEFVPLRIVGEGGMGIVYRALQKYPQRIVALKVFKGSGGYSVQRFDREISVLARLQHRYIAQLYGVGRLDHGPGGLIPFMAMEFVDGEPLTTYAETHKLDIKQRITLMAKVCDAVAYAHTKGIIHRDLKPANILVNADGEPKVLDFGLAVIRDNSERRFTEDGNWLGTLDYASPEQVSAQKDIDERTDIYALGIILYELLTGDRPYQLSKHSWDEAMRVLRDDTISRPSMRVSRCRGDLDTIVLKAGSKDRAARYNSISELKADLDRFLNDQPILARPPTLMYVSRKYVRRNRVPILAVALVIFVLCLGLFLTAREARRANREADRANEQVKLAQQQLAAAQLSEGDALFSANRLPEARKRYDQSWETASAAGVSTLPAQLALWELNGKAAYPFEMISDAKHLVCFAAYSPAKRKVALDFYSGRFEVLDLETGTRDVLVQGTQHIRGASWTPNGRYLCAWDNDWCQIWDFGEGERLVKRIVPDATMERLFLNDSTVAIVSGSQPDQITRFYSITDAPPPPWQIPPNAFILNFSNHDITFLGPHNILMRFRAGSSDVESVGEIPWTGMIGMNSTNTLFACQKGKECVVYECSSGLKEVARFQAPGPFTRFIGEDLLSFDDSFVKRGNITTVQGAPWAAYPINAQGILDGCGDTAIINDPNGECWLWAFAQDQMRREVASRDSKPTAETIDSTGNLAAVGYESGNVAIIDLEHQRQVRSMDGTFRVGGVAFFQDSNRIAVARQNGVVEVWEISSGNCTASKSLKYVMGPTLQVRKEHVFVETTGSQISILDADDHLAAQSLECSSTLLGFDVNPDGTALCASTQTETELWDLTRHPFVRTGLNSSLLKGGPIAFTDNGNRIVEASKASRLVVWDRTGQMISEGEGPSATIRNLYGSRGALFASVHPDAIELWQTEPPLILRRLPIHVNTMSVSDDAMKILGRNLRDGVFLLNFEAEKEIKEASDILRKDGPIDSQSRQRAYKLAGRH